MMMMLMMLIMMLTLMLMARMVRMRGRLRWEVSMIRMRVVIVVFGITSRISHKLARISTYISSKRWIMGSVVRSDMTGGS
jgi:hypothetical protein